MLTCNYQFKLKPNKRQIIDIENYLTACRKVWNYALAERKDWSNSRKSNIDRCSLEKEYIIPADADYPSYKLQAASLTEAKKVCPDLKDINAQVRDSSATAIRPHICGNEIFKQRVSSI